MRNVEKLAKKGLIFNQPNRYGLIAYRLIPFIDVGVFEYTFMGKIEDTEENRKLVQLFASLSSEVKSKLKQIITSLNFVKNRLLADRTMPFTKNKATGEEIDIIVDESIDVPKEKV